MQIVPEGAKMSRDKQNEIHELAKQMSEAISTAVEQRYIEDEAKLRAVLIENGWRESSEVASDIFAEIDDFQRTLRHIFLDMCGGNDYNTLNLLQIDSAIEALFDSRIAELKKKYTVTDTNVGCKTEEGK